MKNIKTIIGMVLIAGMLFSCQVNDDNFSSQDDLSSQENRNINSFLSGIWVQEDQKARPAVNTVFTSSSSKDLFNVTIPSEQGAAFQAMYQTNLEALSPAYNDPADANALGLTSAGFTGLLATDVLNVSLDGTTTFFDGVNVLTGRTLADDVITVELLLIFGGEDFTENPGLSDDHVDANDKAFLSSFPYLASPW